MARQIEQLTIFVSGTSEITAEKSALNSVIQEMNPQLESSRSITLRLIGWPDSFYPGIHKDPQMEINRQLADKYDIFVGILGGRFGTPTPRAGSGTKEEFETAFSKFVKDTKWFVKKVFLHHYNAY